MSQKVKGRKKKLMGFGHRIYKNYDPRAAIIKKTAYEVPRTPESFAVERRACVGHDGLIVDYLRTKVFEVCGREPLIEVAIELERQALADEYFVSRSRCARTRSIRVHCIKLRPRLLG